MITLAKVYILDLGDGESRIEIPRWNASEQTGIRMLLCRCSSFCLLRNSFFLVRDVDTMCRVEYLRSSIGY